MKKMLAAVVTAILVAGGMLAVATLGPAKAGPPSVNARVATAPVLDAAACTYPACVRTRTRIFGAKRLRPGGTVRPRVTVRALQGTARPVGQIRVVVRRKTGGYKRVDTVPYTGPRQRFTFGPLPRGTYKVAARYIPRQTSVFQGSKSRYQLKVRPRPRRR